MRWHAVRPRLFGRLPSAYGDEYSPLYERGKPRVAGVRVNLANLSLLTVVPSPGGFPRA